MASKTITTSEKNTDHEMLTVYNSVFGYDYSTGINRELFDGKIPDGYDIINDETLIIIENKKKTTKFREAKKQILDKYITRAVKRFKNIYCIIGTNSGEQFGYMIYNYNDEQFVRLDIDLDDLYNIIHPKREELVVDPHSINQYLYDNSINIPKTQKTLFLSFMLIVLKIDPLFIEHYNSLPIDILIDKMFNIIDEKYNDRVFTNQFDFIRRSLHNKHIPKIISMLSLYMTRNKNQNCDMLNKFYNEFCIYDKNGEGKLGIVLTPDDIVELMVKELDIKPADYVLDTCTGTGSFLVKSSQYTDHLVGCENNEERYALAKCNFILHDMDYKHLYHESCFNVEFPVCDKLIINPPFGCDCIDEKSSRNDTSWKSFKREQKFVLHAIQFIREGGMGAVIIPCSNFRNDKFKVELSTHITPLKTILCDKKLFEPTASVQCTIMIFVKNKSDLTFMIDTVDRTNMNNIRHKQSTVESTDDWNYNETTIDINREDFETMILEYDIKTMMFGLECFDQNKIIDIYHLSIRYRNGERSNISLSMKHISIDTFRMKRVIIGDILSHVKCPVYQTSKSKAGDIPLYGATQYNTPVKYISNYSYNSDKIVLGINKTGDGGAGYCHLRNGMFAVNSSVALFDISDSLTFEDIVLLDFQLKNTYSRANSINVSKFIRTTVYIFDADI